MISINTFSLFDLATPVMTGLVLIVFLYRSIRVTHKRTEFLFSVSIFLAFTWSLLIFFTDNVVPTDQPASSVPNAAARTLFLYKLQFCNGVLFLASLTHFSLRHCQSEALQGWRFLWLYCAALLLMMLSQSETFLIPPTTPLTEKCSWRMAVPWMPKPGPVAMACAALPLIVAGFLFYLFWTRSRRTQEHPLVERQIDGVWVGVTGFLLAAIIESIHAITGYSGVSFGSFTFGVSMVVLGLGVAEEHRRSELERQHVIRRFQNYVDPALVKFVIDHPDQVRFDGEVRELTVVFSDLAGFTALTEKLRVGAVSILNEYFSVMTPIIHEHHGYRDRFLGDGMMFFYGAPEKNPDHAIHAVATVLKMEETMLCLNERLSARNLPALSMRTGVSTGEMIVGDSGSDDASHYTVHGNAVNLGSRLESANKAAGTRILLSQRTVELLPADLFLVRPIGKFVVFGLNDPVMTYEPLAHAARATDLQKTTAELTRVMVERFLQGDFRGCLQAEERMTQLLGPSQLSKLYREQSEHYLAFPPVNGFAGQIVLAAK